MNHNTCIKSVEFLWIFILYFLKHFNKSHVMVLYYLFKKILNLNFYVKITFMGILMDLLF